MGCSELINYRKGRKDMKKRFWKDRIKKAVKILTGGGWNYYGAYSYSQEGEDILTVCLLNQLKKREISYCDIGANEPVRLNNTYLLENEFTIKKGVLVEPNPVLYEELKKVRKSNVCLNVGVCGKEKAELSNMKFYIMNSPTLSSFSSESVAEAQNRGYKIKKEIDVKIVDVNTVFEKYFYAEGLEIDFLNLDVEGMDFEIISSIDFEKYHPLIICVETCGFYTGKDADGMQIIDFLLSKGYIVYADTFLNTIFVLRTEMEKYCKDIKTIYP